MSMTEVKINYLILLVELQVQFQMIIKLQAQTMQKWQSVRCTYCPNSLTRFHFLLQVNCISGLM